MYKYDTMVVMIILMLTILVILMGLVRHKHHYYVSHTGEIQTRAVPN